MVRTESGVRARSDNPRSRGPAPDLYRFLQRFQYRDGDRAWRATHSISLLRGGRLGHADLFHFGCPWWVVADGDLEPGLGRQLGQFNFPQLDTVPVGSRRHRRSRADGWLWGSGHFPSGTTSDEWTRRRRWPCPPCRPPTPSLRRWPGRTRRRGRPGRLPCRRRRQPWSGSVRRGGAIPFPRWRLTHQLLLLGVATSERVSLIRRRPTPCGSGR